MLLAKVVGARLGFTGMRGSKPSRRRQIHLNSLFICVHVQNFWRCIQVGAAEPKVPQLSCEGQMTSSNRKVENGDFSGREVLGCGGKYGNRRKCS